tara:strand:+ start:269 stop:1453 length:1185 start_codon:yes stop_codon:yes gene_type:complete
MPETHGISPSFTTDLKNVQRHLVQDEVTGSNVMLVFQNGKPIYEHVFNSHRNGDKDITENTLFPIASLTKPITIVAVMILAEQGLLDINTAIKEYLPVFSNIKVKNDNAVEGAKNDLLVHHLMAHRSGYSYNYPKSPDSPLPRQGRFRNLEEYVNVVAETPLEFEPGTNFAYGINQAILGRLVEVVSNEPFESFLQKNIFQPLNMNNTSFSLTEKQWTYLQPMFIKSGNLKGYTNMEGLLAYFDPMVSNFDPDSRAHFGGEGLVSTMSDYANFCEMLTSMGAFNNKKIVQSASIEEIIKPRTTENVVRAAFYNNSGLDNWWAGYDVGHSVFIKNEYGKDNTLAPIGIFGWAGLNNTHFWIDIENKIFGLFMSRSLEFNWNIPIQLRAALYGSKK